MRNNRNTNYFTGKYLTILLTITMLLTVVSPSILAADIDDLVEEYNQRIENEIKYAQAKADEVLADDDTEEEITSEIDEIIEELIAETDMIAGEGMAESEELGYNVGCVDIEVTIAGRTVIIDPLIVLAD